MRIRPAKREDIPQLSRVAARSYADAFGHTMSPQELATELRETRSEAYFTEKLNEDTILVAEDGDTIVGYVQFGNVKIPEATPAPGDQELRRIYIDTKRQGQGIGRQLMDAALITPPLATAKCIYLQVWEENKTALGLYKSYGFEEVGKTSFTIGNGETVEDLIMTLGQVE